MKKSERQTYFLAIVSLQLSGNAEGRISPGEICNFRFLFANGSIALRPAVVKATGLNHQSELLHQNCNLKIHNALWRIFREQKSAVAAPQGFENRET